MAGYLLRVVLAASVLIPSPTFLAVQALPTSCRVEETGDGRTPLCLLVMMPYPDDNPALHPSWDQGPNVVPAIELAVELVNNDSNILKEYILGLAHDDSGCDIYTKATTGFTRSVLGGFHDHPIVGIIGPACSTSTLTVLPLSGRPEISLFATHIAGSPLLESRTLYPYGYSLLDSSRNAAEALLVLVHKAGWRRVAILYEESRLYFRTTYQALESAIAVDEHGVEISFSAGVSESYIPLSVIRSELIRVVVLLTAPTLAETIMCLGYHRYDMVFSAYQWVLVGRSFSEVNSAVSFRYDAKPYSCSTDLMLDTVLTGAILMNYQLKPMNDTAPTSSGLSYDRFLQLYNERVAAYNSNQNNPYVNITVNVWATTVFDAVWAQALAMNNSNVNLSNYSYGNPTVTNRIRDEFPKLDFHGVSGHVTFDNETGFTKRVYDVYQVQDMVEVYVAHVDDGHLHTDGTSAVFINDEFDNQPITVHPAVAAIMVLLLTVQLVAVIALHVLTIKYRNYRSVKASSPRINQVIFIGVYMLIAANGIYAIYKAIDLSDESVERFCQVMWPWLLSIGFTLIFGPLIARTWRLYRIFTHFTNPGGVLLSEPALIAFVGLLLVPDLIIAIVWTAIDPFRIEVVEQHNVEGELGQQTIELRRVCDCEYFLLWAVLIYGYKFSMILVIITLSQLTRNILSRDFTTKTLRVLVYIFSIAFALGTMLFQVPYSTIYGAYIVLCCDLIVAVTLLIALVFLPPLLPLLKEKYEKVSKSVDPFKLHTRKCSTSSDQPLQ